MDYFQPVAQTVFTVGIGFCLGWYACKKSFRVKPLTKAWGNVRDEVKLVLVVRNDLGMSKGKVAAQCSHATLECYEMAMERCPQVVSQWKRNGQMKITLKAPDYEAIDKLRSAASNAGLPHCLIHDAGHTQIPAGSATVLGIGPAESRLIDKITGHLKLY